MKMKNFNNISVCMIICMLFGHRIIDKNIFFEYKKTKICTTKCDRCKENLVGLSVKPKYQNEWQWAYNIIR